MPTRWETYPIKLKGGLISNVARLQQGMEIPGSARFLQNFEPSIQGGYRRINGYLKFDDSIVPDGDVKVQGSGQTGTSLDVANMLVEPPTGTTITISGVSGTYTIDAISYDGPSNTATLTLDTSLASSPADQADITITNSTELVRGLHFFDHNLTAYALRSGLIWRSTGSGWTKHSTPDYGTVLVDGGSQTGTSLVIDGIDDDDYVPITGDTFTVAGIEKVYTVTADATATSGSATLTITPSLASSPADDAAITFLNSDLGDTTKARSGRYNFDGTEHFLLTTKATYPVQICQGNTYKTIQGSSDVKDADFVVEFKDHIFYIKEDLVTFTAPFTADDFTAANGAGSFYLSTEATGAIVFREELIIFMEDGIKRLTGTSESDWQLLDISTKVGCVAPDTIQEVGGDIIFLGPDGVRFLGATDRNQDFSLQLASRPIQKELTDFIEGDKDYCSTVIRQKNQYRLFKYETNVTDTNARGYIGVQFIDQSGKGFEWSALKGIRAFRVHSAYVGETEYIIFASSDGYVYRMDSGSTFDGSPIEASYYSPFLPINDPLVRKTIYKVNTYHDPENVFEGTLTLKYDFEDPDKIQPTGNTYSSGGDFYRFGEGTYGTSKWGGIPTTVVKTMVVGSFFTASLEYTFDSTDDPFILDTIMIEYATEDRK